VTRGRRRDRAAEFSDYEVEANVMAWDHDAVRQLAETREIDVVAPAPDRPAVRTPIWIVAVDGGLYVRSWKGDAGRWYRRARRYGTGSVIASGQQYAVRFVAASPDSTARINAAYLRKYGSSPHARAMTRPSASATTMRLEPAP
jgi:hypothetical protein